MIEKQIVGKWKWYSITYDFYGDGTYDYVNVDSGVRNSGTYSVSGNIITFLIGSAAEIFLSGDKLTMTPIRPSAGNTVTFSRVL